MACIAVYCSRELFPIPVTYVYIIYSTPDPFPREGVGSGNETNNTVHA